MKEYQIFIENEKQANYIVAKVMQITFLIFTFIYILDVIGVFIVNIKIMAIADVFDAVSEKRCYRDAMPLEKWRML